mmetsp:Transcript_80219/g.166987  ORF Transcript_80219/g.166987 Transcript_80219/m.166987 type:complete len:232 (+) Transcript_80219:875-1570(+)
MCARTKVPKRPSRDLPKNGSTVGRARLRSGRDDHVLLALLPDDRRLLLALSGCNLYLSLAMGDRNDARCLLRGGRPEPFRWDIRTWSWRATLAACCRAIFGVAVVGGMSCSWNSFGRQGCARDCLCPLDHDRHSSLPLCQARGCWGWSILLLDASVGCPVYFRGLGSCGWSDHFFVVARMRYVYLYGFVPRSRLQRTLSGLRTRRLMQLWFFFDWRIRGVLCGRKLGPYAG